MTIKHLALAGLTAAGSLAVPATPAAAGDCVSDAVKSCDADFPPKDHYLIAIRGWCYLVRIALCPVT